MAKIVRAHWIPLCIIMHVNFLTEIHAHFPGSKKERLTIAEILCCP